MKTQKFLDSPQVGLDRADGQPSHLAGCLELLEQLHIQKCLSQELLGQFAPNNGTQVQLQKGLDRILSESILNAIRVDKK